MKRHTSIYLDLARVLAAAAVFMSHARRGTITGGFLAPLGEFGAEGVAVFFVISGFVIAHVVATKERAFGPYMASRLSRLWSVVVPAVILTIVADSIGRRLAPGIYAPVPGWGLDLKGLWQAIAPVLFLNKFGPISVDPGSNGPFWSLCYEFWYYVAFGILVFARGWLRVAGLVALGALVGPRILLLMPLWLLGVVIYHWTNSAPPHIRFASAAWIATCVCTGAGLAFKYKLAGLLTLDPSWWVYFVGFGFAGSILLFDSMDAGLFVRAIRFFSPAIRFCADRSFSLYLYQAPLLFLSGALTAHLSSHAFRIVLVYAITLSGVFILSAVTEQKKYLVYRLFVRMGIAPQKAAAARRPAPTVFMPRRSSPAIPPR